MTVGGGSPSISDQQSDSVRWRQGVMNPWSERPFVDLSHRLRSQGTSTRDGLNRGTPQTSNAPAAVCALAKLHLHAVRLEFSPGPGGRLTAAMLFGRDAERAHLEELLDAVASGPVGCILEGNARYREDDPVARGGRKRSAARLPGSRDDGLRARVGACVLGAGRSVRAASGCDPRLAPGCAGGRAEGGPVRWVSCRRARATSRPFLARSWGCCATLSAAGPVLIAIDDEQWLDPASARVLAFALCRLQDEHVVVILARRPEPQGILSAEFGRRFRGRALDTVSLEPLPLSTSGRSSRRG